MPLQNVFCPGDILLPKGGDLTRWSVVACDQYTSEPDYWNQVDAFVGDAPSTLRLTLPELYLDRPDTDDRIRNIGETMKDYLSRDLFACYPNSCIYLERTLADGRVRRGLVGCLDLEQYDYQKGSVSPIRATEGTVVERIPPRLQVRKDAQLELPHIMMLLDDPEGTVIEPISRITDRLQKVYDFDMMQNSGSIKGWVVSGADYAPVDAALAALADPAHLDKLYGTHEAPLLFAAGDGNHSLATAKESFERIKKQLPEEQWKVHPARYALVELVNLHDSSLVFEPIHRAIFDVDPAALLARLQEETCGSEQPGGEQKVHYFTADTEGDLYFTRTTSQLTVGTLQQFLDRELKEHGGRADYIHGDEVAADLGRQPGCISFLLPPMEKSQLFPTVMKDGALPRKTFSMGHACDKRFYLEARRVR